LCVEIYGQLTDAESPNAIDTNDANSISTMLNTTLSLSAVTSDYNVTEIQLLINAIKGLVLDGDFTTADANTINDDYVFYFAPGFFPVDFSPFFHQRR
jgi:hypothetical protein